MNSKHNVIDMQESILGANFGTKTTVFNVEPQTIG